MSFTQQVGTFAVKSLEDAAKLIKGVQIKLFSSVILSTPVDTGRLRANWVLSEDEPTKEHNYDVKDPSGATAIARVVKGVQTAQPLSGRPVFLVNNLDYAARIEFDGWSHTKAPEGMVRINVARITALLAARGQ